MVQNITIPLNSPLDLSGYGITEPENNVAFETKETVMYRNCLANMRSVTGSGISTTAGGVISMKDGEVFYNDTNISFEGQYFLDEVKPVPANVPGTYTSAFVNAVGDIIVFSKGTDDYYLTRFSKDDTKSTTPVKGLLTAISLSTDYLEINNDSVILKDGDTYEEKSSWTLPHAIRGKSVTVTLKDGIYILGFDDLDQRKRFTYILDPSSSVPSKEIQYFGTVSPDGKITGEPLPIKHPGSANAEWSNALLFSNTSNKNGVVKWDLSSNPGISMTQEIADNNSNFRIPTDTAAGLNNWQWSNHPRFSGMCIVSELYVENKTFKISIPDYQMTMPAANANRFLTPYPYDLGIVWDLPADKITETTNVFPTRYVFTNQTENRNKYWGYGLGWSKFLCFEYNVWRGTVFTEIMTCPLKILSGKLVEVVDPTGNAVASSWPTTNFSLTPEQKEQWLNIDGKLYRVHRFIEQTKSNKEWVPLTHTIGGSNADGWIFRIPFTAHIIGERDKDQPYITSQIYTGLTVSYGAETTLLSTPSDENERNIWAGPELKQGLFPFCDGFNIFYIQIWKDKKTAPLKVSKIADYCYRFNVLDNKNFLKESSGGAFDLVQGFSRYNMDSKWNIEHLSLALPPDGIEHNDLFFWAAGFNQELNEENPLTTFLYPAVQLGIYLKENDRVLFNDVVIKLKNPILLATPAGFFVDEEDYVDVYYTHTLQIEEIGYKYTCYADKTGTKFFNSNKEGFIWTSAAVEIIFPVGMGSQVESENFITPTITLSNNYSVRLFNKNNQTFISFNTVNKIYKGKAIFTIYGGNYIYDGQGIYYVGSANDYSQSQFVCYALGLKFLANSGTEAYFYSPWEKQLYLFTGSNTLQPADSFSALGDVVDSLFSSNEQTLYLLFDQLDKDENLLVIRTPQDQGAMEVEKNLHLESTENGGALVSNTQLVRDANFKVLSPYKGTALPFRAETEYIGDNSTLYKFPYVDIMLVGKNKNLTFTVTFNVINGINTVEEVHEVELKTRDWKANTYRYSFNPTNMIGNSCKLSIESENDIYISYIGIGFDDSSATPGAPITRAGARK